jgi:hypothetical protein
MKNKINILMVVVLVAGLVGHAAGAGEDSAHTREYKIKAAFIYNFIKFVQWPEEANEGSEKTSKDNDTITIGIIGKDPFGDAFEPVKNKPAKGREIVIKQFGEFKRLVNDDDKARSEANIKALRQCQLLFICSSEIADCGRIIEMVRDHSVLTVGEIVGFAEAGGIINFIPRQKKAVFEVNLVASKRANLEVSSKLLRVAKRVITEKDLEKAKD